MRMLVVGAGATGGYFGGRLAEAGRNVSFLLRPGRAAALRADGLRISSPSGDVTIQPRIVQAGAIDGRYDAVLLTVKSFSLDQAIEDMTPAVGPGTMILPVLNGMRHVDQLRMRFWADTVAGCVCKIAATLDDAGRILHLAPVHDLAYSEMDGRPSDRMAALDEFVRGAGFDATLSPSIERQMWEKWILLAALGAIGCLMRGTVGEIEAAPGGTRFVLALLDEVVSIVRTVGTPPSEAFLVAARTQLTAKGSSFTSSMYRDLQKGLRLEADQILGDLLLRGDRAGVAAPLLGAAYANLSVFQARPASS
jgi:2-dehydropantoate 2-reductase